MSTTHVLIITDMSGSMSKLAADVRGGFNSYIEDLRKDTDATYKATVTLFDHRYMPLCAAATLDQVPALDDHNYVPAGSTALLDAVGRTIGQFDQATTLEPDDRVLLVIQTDGQENSSIEWKFAAISKLITAKEATGQWSVNYLGAGKDSWDQANAMGINSANYINTADTSAGTIASYSGLATATRSYSKGASGQSVGDTLRGVAGV